MVSTSPTSSADSLRQRVFNITWHRAMLICLLTTAVFGYFIIGYYNYNFHSAQGRKYYLKGDYPHAIEEYSAAIQSNGSDESLYVNRGLAYTFKYDYTNADADYNKAIQMNPQDYYAYYARGLNLYHQYEYDKAIAQFDQSLSLNPSYVNAYYYNGLSYEQAGDNSNAIANFKKVLQMSQDPTLQGSAKQQILDMGGSLP